MRIIIICILLLTALKFSPLYSQSFNRPLFDTLKTSGTLYKFEIGGLASNSSRTPFWLRSNQFGSVPIESPSAIAIFGAKTLLGNPSQNKKPYFKASVEAVGNATRNSRLIIPEAYGSINLGHGELYIGRKKEINGITDTLLTSGSYAWSGNAVPITQIKIGTRDYTPIKFTKNIISVNAFFSHGWFTNTDSIQNAYLHAKAVYVKIGKPEWKLNFYGGMSHYVQWGGYSKYLGKTLAKDGHLPSDWKAYKKALWPSSVGEKDSGNFTEFDTANRSGNHLGSIDLALEVKLKYSQLLIYVQRPWEDMSGVVFGNLPDGLYGFRWKNSRKTVEKRGFKILQITAEFLTTMNQSGAKYPKGNDDYFHNYQYIDGWSHEKRIIGTPFITRWMDADPKWKTLRGPFGKWSIINNNRIQLIHVGAVGRLQSGATVQAMISGSRNFGRPYSLPPKKGGALQISGLFESYFPNFLNKKVTLKTAIAVDKGEWLTDSIALNIAILKTGWF